MRCKSFENSFRIIEWTIISCVLVCIQRNADCEWTLDCDPIYDTVKLSRIELKGGIKPFDIMLLCYGNFQFRFFAFFYAFHLTDFLSFTFALSFHRKFPARFFVTLFFVLSTTMTTTTPSPQRKLLLWNLRPFKSNANTRQALWIKKHTEHSKVLEKQIVICYSTSHKHRDHTDNRLRDENAVTKCQGPRKKESNIIFTGRKGQLVSNCTLNIRVSCYEIKRDKKGNQKHIFRFIFSSTSE